MKHFAIFLAMSLLLILPGHYSNAQADVTSHSGATGQWCGWDQITNFDFQLRHDGARNITFHTDATILK